MRLFSRSRSGRSRSRRDPTGSAESPPSESASAPRTRGGRLLGEGPGPDRDDRTDFSCSSLASRFLRVNRLKVSVVYGGNSSVPRFSGLHDIALHLVYYRG